MNKPISQEAADFLLDDFQRKVDSAIREYEHRTTTTRTRHRRIRGAKFFSMRRRSERVKKDSARRMESRIGRLLQQPEVRESLCRVLQKVTDDVFEVSKAITPVLLTLIATGTLDIKPIPLMFAGIALSIVRMGVAGFCSGRSTKARAASPRKSPKGNKR